MGSKINRFLEIYNLPRLNKKIIKQMNRSIKTKDIGWIIKKLYQHRTLQSQMASLINSGKHLKKKYS